MSKHTGDKPYKCTICDQTFPVKNALVMHERHTVGENPLKCSYCDKDFF